MLVLVVDTKFFQNSVKIACKGAFYIKKNQACKSGENCVGVDHTLLYHQNTYDLFLCCKFI